VSGRVVGCGWIRWFETGVLVLALQVSAGITVLVATDGDDTNPGTREKPFAALGRAQVAVREAGAPGSEVIVRGGTYYLSKPLALDAADSGTVGAPAVYRAAKGEVAMLSGARAVIGFHPFKGRILRASLSDWELAKTHCRQLSVDGVRMEMARRPNADPKRPYSGGWSYVGGKSEDMQKAEHPRDRLAFREGDVGRYAYPRDGEVHVYSGKTWSSSILPITAIDYDTNVIQLAGKAHPLGILPGNRYYVRGLLEELDAPGEWCVDRREKVLYFWPPEPLKSDAVVTMPILPAAVRLGRGKGPVKHLHFRGVIVESADVLGIEAYQAEDCLIVGNTVRQVSSRPGWSSAGIIVQGKCRRVRVVGNDVYDVGAYGIAIRGGNSLTLERGENSA